MRPLYGSEEWLKQLKLAPKTKGNIRNTIAVVLNCAMRWGLLDLAENPMRLVRVKSIGRRQTEPRVLMPREIQALLAELGDDPYRTIVIMAYQHGAAVQNCLRCAGWISTGTNSQS